MAADELRKSRPTAVNLFGAIERIERIVKQRFELEIDELKQNIIQEALKIADEDVQMNLRIARNGQQFIPDHANLIHHCNTGALSHRGYRDGAGCDPDCA